MINEWYNLQVKELPITEKAMGVRYKNKFKKNLFDVLNTDPLFRVEDLCTLAIYLDVEYDNRIHHCLVHLEINKDIEIFQTEECIYITKT